MSSGGYGTIVVDLERGGVVDLLPDREFAGLAAVVNGYSRRP
jgi:hypothetical protein